MLGRGTPPRDSELTSQVSSQNEVSMIDQRIAGSGDTAREAAAKPADAQHATDPLEIDQHQPDPMLQMSTGRLGGGGLSFVALAIVVLLAIVFYGLNGRNTKGPTTPLAPVAANSGAPHG
jgi:hypothetical protein